ncbi:MAG: hypothetical protein ACYDGR_07650 [Candidatus Dormibacteria bacterium]
MKGTRACALFALLLIAAARVAIPAAPAMYEGFNPVAPPYRYCNPPSNLASTNQRPNGGGGDMQTSGDTNQLGTFNTGDKQALAFFSKGSLKAPGATRFHVSITPECNNPVSPPSGNRLVGNAYDISVMGEPGDLPVTFVRAAQVLLRTPPVRYTSIQLYHSAAWHSTPWSAQVDFANTAIDNSGALTALDDGSSNPRGRPPRSGPGFVGMVEIILVSAAIVLIVGAIIVQHRRGGGAIPPRRR